jgi:hypothetical protein
MALRPYQQPSEPTNLMAAMQAFEEMLTAVLLVLLRAAQ